VKSSKKYDVIIIGGGLAGLTTALHLSKQRLSILLIEKYEYPHHKVCGEYVSNEVMPYLRSLGIDPFSLNASEISNFEISTNEGKIVKSKLPLGGFGISRYELDNLMFQKIKENVDVVFETVEKVLFSSQTFTVRTIEKETYQSEYVLGAFGKRSLVDSFLDRDFIKQKSPWLGVKAHYKYDFPADKVALHNFEGGYCGLSQVENGIVNACYLATFKSFKPSGSIEIFQKEVLSKNPHLKHFFTHAELLFEKPLTISQISFEKKQPVESHIFMVGDSAGLIHPLCGNGMAMAIHSAKIFSELFIAAKSDDMNRERLETTYTLKWNETFSKRLKTGRVIQNLLLNPKTAKLGFKAAQLFPFIVPQIIKKTHGEVLL
jgi:flavin-dependent dehydrogenase